MGLVQQHRNHPEMFILGFIIIKKFPEILLKDY